MPQITPGKRRDSTDQEGGERRERGGRSLAVLAESTRGRLVTGRAAPSGRAVIGITTRSSSTHCNHTFFFRINALPGDWPGDSGASFLSTHRFEVETRRSYSRESESEYPSAGIG